ncbi:YodC family protein [Acinetobacter sp. A47]|uniref:YodC family protein n=1 Tax=Acinetobacter sp. A47 TaxID=1561217 RepID=UPI00056F3BA3|nr:DUF2158 domain-containing protein [Acinetobacter sp. A47]
MRELKAGDVVTLQSDGEYMTVERIYENGKVWCVWFVDGDIKTYEFYPEALKLIRNGNLD